MPKNYRSIVGISILRRRQVVGGRDKPGHDTWGTMRRAISADSVVFGRCLSLPFGAEFGDFDFYFHGRHEA
jgi:hypothetical protein